jgi:hypothetical protein
MHFHESRAETIDQPLVIARLATACEVSDVDVAEQPGRGLIELVRATKFLELFE